MADAYSCLACRATLVADADALVCRACARRYPVRDGIPVLVAKPLEHLAASATVLERLLGEHRGKIRMLDELLARQTSRDAALRVLRAAFDANGQFFADRRIAIGAVPSVPASGPPRPLASARMHPALADPQVGYITDVVDYVRQDWSTLPDCREDVAAILAAVERGLAAHATRAKRCVVLGAGLGRFAHELANRFEHTLALDLSVVMGLTYAALRARAHTVYEINERIAFDVAGLARPLVARIPDPPAPIDYIVADGRALPIADGSADAIVSIFFTDVIRLSALLAEVGRVLAPGGAFVHFGPLGYHFYAPEEMPTAEEVRGVFARHGFTLHDEAWVPVWMQRSTARMSNSRIEAWSFVAVRDR